KSKSPDAHFRGGDELFRAAFTVILFLLCAAYFQAAVAQSGTPDPCAGPDALLSAIDRPTVGDSPCVVKAGQALSEAGVARYVPDSGGGHSLSYPQLELRFGLPDNNELVLLPPNVNRVMTPLPGGGGQTSSGGSASIIGLKHQFGYHARWLWAGETLVTLPSGSPDFGSAATGYAVNGIVGYNLTPDFALTLMFGVTHLAEPANLQAGAYYWSLNPDLVATWQIAERWQLYAEVYGQRRTGPDKGRATTPTAAFSIC
ncbi:MAG: transporter, partial [Gammaproteobacteria bacterium]|nr:transporter [Gammaproteobacteria bacterium]